MSRLPVIRGALVDEDLLSVWSYIAVDDESAADRLLERLARRWELLATQPYSGKARDDIDPGLRQVVVGQYLTLYAVYDTHIEIVRVLHGRRDLTARDLIP